MNEWRAELWAALVALLVALGASLRARLKRGERIFPRVRLRGYLSIRSPSDHPRPPGDPRVEIIDSSTRPPRMTEVERDADTRKLDRVDDDDEQRKTLKPTRRRPRDKGNDNA